MHSSHETLQYKIKLIHRLKNVIKSWHSTIQQDQVDPQTMECYQVMKLYNTRSSWSTDYRMLSSHETLQYNKIKLIHRLKKLSSHETLQYKIKLIHRLKNVIKSWNSTIQDQVDPQTKECYQVMKLYNTTR